MTSRAALPARRGLPRRTEARAERTLAVARFIHPLAGVWGGFFSPHPCLSGEDWGSGQSPDSKPPFSNTGVTFSALFHVEPLGVESCEKFVL